MTTRLLIIGMPGSGKTTFVAALRHLLQSGETKTALNFVKLSDNEVHLNKLGTTWLACEEFTRTNPSSETWVTLHIRDEANKETDLLLPDLSGETFRSPVATGYCQKILFDVMVNADGIMIFTNAGRRNDDLMITQVTDLLEKLEEDGNINVPVSPFQPENMPEESQLVELLQLVNRRPLVAKHRPVAVIISAWDIGMEDMLSPAEWLQQKRPMLAQFLQFNPLLWNTRIYGISAQGGSLPRDKDKLQSHAKPSKKITIVGHDALKHDLTAPIKWLIAMSQQDSK